MSEQEKQEKEKKIKLARWYMHPIDPRFMPDFHHVDLKPCECNKDVEQYVSTVCENPDGEHLVGIVVHMGDGVRLVVKVRKGDELGGEEFPHWNVAPDLKLVRGVWNRPPLPQTVALFVAIVDWQQRKPEEKVLNFGGAEYFFRDGPLPWEDEPLRSI